MNKKISSFIVVSILLLVVIIYSAITGSIKMEIAEFIRAIFGEENSNYAVIKDLRFPRIIVAIFAGAGLSVAGVLLQAVMRNPLADAGVIGISAGASFVQLLVITLFPMTFFFTPILAFFGGAFACFLVFMLSWKSGLNPLKIILVGIAINAMFTGLTEAFVTLCSYMNIMVGGAGSSNLSMRTWSDVRLISFYGVIGLLASLLIASWCNLLALQDKTAKSLGFNVTRARLIIAAIAVLLAAISTATAGVIAFVGLLIPHISRRLVGSDHKWLIPFSAIAGALLILTADTLGRIVVAPLEVPASTIMAIIGGPFLIFLIRKDK
ncbi:iron ABC transporter permease [Lysinibacillus sp. CD3-6]|uniref:FecCD family ABC transporter permease n=1 Tax=Lysinibacillus sp. CD3-6 TaxID=2892541 RepID=UPI001173280F|nr:iron ABC transporter permease [Lysinibacillus sp. CD3-6]UED81707.1 iron ABC transporter permease [Lysinibacillus sp. CD3-6]